MPQKKINEQKLVKDVVDKVASEIQSNQIEEVPVQQIDSEKVKSLQEQYVKDKLKPRIYEVTHYMEMTNKKLPDLYNDIENKTSGLSRLNRDFLIYFKNHIDKLFSKKYL